MRITDVEPGFIFEGENPQYAQLQHLLTTAREPWERNQIKWRIENLRSSEALAGEPGGGSGAPLDAKGNYIPVLPTKEWMARNPSIVKTLPNDALPPTMQKPGVLDKVKKAWDNWTPAYKRDAENLERSREEQGLGNFGGAAGRFNQNESVELDRIKALTSKVLKG
jgi:hypothetical protein